MGRNAKAYAVVYTLALTMTCAPGVAKAATPTVYLQDSTIVGSSGTLTLSRLPFTNSSGTIKYNDVTIPFSVNSSGGLAIGTPTIVTSIAPVTSNFVAGTYTVMGGKADTTIHVNGPASGTGGTTVWTLEATAPDTSSPLTSAQWTVGPLSDSPAVAAYIKAYSIPVDPNATYGFGVYGGYSDILVALSQVSGTLGVREYTGQSLGQILTYTRTGP